MSDENNEKICHNGKERRYTVIFCAAVVVYLLVCAIAYILSDVNERNAYVDIKPLTSENSAVSESEKVNINTATAEELKTLSGIGDVTAERIIEYREKFGGFLSVDELENVKGIGEKLIDKIRPYIKI